MQNKNTRNLEDIIESANEGNLPSVIQAISSISLTEYLQQLLNEKHLSKADVIQKSQLSRTYAYQIFQGKKQASRDKIIQLAFAMNLCVEETNRLLKTANHSILYVKKKRDAILQYGLQRQMNLYTVNEYLHSYDLPLLGDFE